MWVWFVCVMCMCSVPHDALAQSSPVNDAIRAARGELRRVAKNVSDSTRSVPLEAARAAIFEARKRAFGTDLSDLVITGVTLTCNAPVCNDRLETLERLSGLHVGDPFAFDRVQRASERLFKTGLFESIDLATEFTPDGIALTLNLTGAVRVDRILFEGLSPPPFREDFKRLLIYREGQPFRALGKNEDRVQWWFGEDGLVATAGEDDGVKRDFGSDRDVASRLQREQERVGAQLQSFRDLLEREGYFAARVGLLAERDDSDPYQVRLTFLIEKGADQRICELGIRGLRQMTYTEARAFILKDRPIWTRYLGFVTPTYTERMLRIGQEALITAYRERGFYQARVVDKRVTSGANDCVQVLLDISEGPRWRTIFRGNRVFSDQDLTDALLFLETGYVDAKAMKDAEERLEQLYATRGHPFADVDCEEERATRLDRTIRCYVEEGSRREIREIRFQNTTNTLPLNGATQSEALTREALLDAMRTRPFGLFETGGFLQLEELMGDVSTIESLYHAQGFIWAQVPGFKVESVEGGGLVITIFIEEGQRVIVQDMIVDKNSEVIPSLLGPTATSRLRALLGTRPDKPLSMVQARADGSRLTQHYAALGYPMGQVQTRCVIDARESDSCELPRVAATCTVRDVKRLKQDHCDWSGDAKNGLSGTCQRIDASQECRHDATTQSPRVSVSHVITPGPFVTVDAIWVSGHHKTRESVLRGELDLEAGSRLDVKRLLEGQANLRSLGLFDSVSIEAVGLDESARTKERTQTVLMLSIEEGDYRYFDFSVGFQGRDMFDSTRRRLLLTSEIEYNNRNWRGRAQRLQPRLIAAMDLLQTGQLGAGVSNGALTPNEAGTNFDYLLGAELVYNNPRFLRSSLGVQKLLLTVAPYYLLDLIGVTLNNLLREEVGTRAEVRKDLSEVVDRLFATFGLQGKVIATRAPDSLAFTEDGDRLFSPRRTIGKFYLDGTLDRRDSPLNPTKGYFLQVSPQLVSGDALGADAGDALNDAFFKLTLGASVYFGINDDLILAQSVRFGQIIPIFGRRRPAPQEERYVLGGVSSLRGVPESGLTTQVASYRDVLRGGEFVLNSNTELRYPLLRRFGFYGATFLDVGVLSDCFDDQNTVNPVSCYTDAFPADAPLSKVRSSAGIGMRYLVGEQVPLLLDYAILLDRRPGERFGYLHFNVGYTF